MKNYRSASSLVAAATLALAAMGMTQVAQAGNVYWSVGVTSPGLQVGVANGAPAVVYSQPYPVYSQPYPVYSQPYPVYSEPYPVYRPRPVIYVQPAPIVYRAPPQYIQADWQHPGRGWGPRHRQGRHDHDRFDSGRDGWERSGHGEREHRRH